MELQCQDFLGIDAWSAVSAASIVLGCPGLSISRRSTENRFSLSNPIKKKSCKTSRRKLRSILFAAMK